MSWSGQLVLRGADLTNEGGDAEGLIGWGATYADAVRRSKPAPSPGAIPWDHIDLSSLAG